MTSTSVRTVLQRYQRLLTGPGTRTLRWGVVAAVISGVVQGLALLALLAAATAMANHGTVAGMSVGLLLAILAGLAVTGFAASYVMSMSGYRGAHDVMRNCHVVIGDRLSSLPMGWFDRDIAGRLSRSMTAGMITLGQVLGHMVLGLITNIAALLTVVVGLWWWNTTVAIIVTAAVPLYLWGMRFVGRAQSRVKRWSEPSKSELASRIVEFARCQGALRAAGRSRTFEPLNAAAHEENRVARKALWLESGLAMIAGTAAQVIVVSLIVVAVVMARVGSLEPIPTIAFIGLALRLMQHLSMSADMSLGVQELEPVLGAINEVMDAEVMVEPECSKVSPGEATIEFDDVTFGYHPARPVLREVSFTVPPRTMTALVGPSGSGKTTIARLAARFYDVQTGVVRVGGEDVRDYTTSDLMSQLSMVFQDVYLFDDTLIENIRVGRPGATDDDVRAAADLAGVTEIVHRLPDGWSTRVGEGGARLSGGERQRVSIARALIKQAPIVLIDEATSALDVENERNIVAAIDQLRANATVLVIAHKLDTIQSADNVVVLSDEGRVVQSGRHEELIGVDGLYRNYWAQRDAARGWTLTPGAL